MVTEADLSPRELGWVNLVRSGESYRPMSSRRELRREAIDQYSQQPMRYAAEEGLHTALPVLAGGAAGAGIAGLYGKAATGLADQSIGEAAKRIALANTMVDKGLNHQFLWAQTAEALGKKYSEDIVNQAVSQADRLGVPGPPVRVDSPIGGKNIAAALKKASPEVLQSWDRVMGEADMFLTQAQRGLQKGQRFGAVRRYGGRAAVGAALLTALIGGGIKLDWLADQQELSPVEQDAKIRSEALRAMLKKRRSRLYDAMEDAVGTGGGLLGAGG